MDTTILSQDGEMTFTQKIEISTMITMVKTFLPDVAKYYPIAMQQLDLLQNKVDEYLGNNEKMIVAFRSRRQISGYCDRHEAGIYNLQ